MSKRKNERVALLPDRVIDGCATEALENLAVIVEGQSIAALVERADIPEDLRGDRSGRYDPDAGDDQLPRASTDVRG